MTQTDERRHDTTRSPAPPTGRGARLGVDTGGTFTDAVTRGPDGRLRVHKLLSTPDDPSRAIADAARALYPDADALAHVALVHGTTVATNALLERAVARAALVTTAGFEDVLTIRRQHRPDLYALDVTLPRPVIDPALCLGARERMTATGEALVPLDDAAIEEVVARLRALASEGLEAVAVCLLHAYANPAHEEALAAAITTALPALFVTTSSALVRELREYERGQTTAVNAAIGPIMATYLQNLRSRLDVSLLEIFLSSGGVAEAQRAAAQPIHTVLSGPAGGVVGAMTAARQVGLDHLITFDMGGTSTDVSLCAGSPTLRNVADLDGLTVLVPTLDIFTVGAGGGSIARLDVGGALRVGPESAGASPGPASYGLGGVAPTVTDAHVVLGRLRPDRFLGGAQMLRVEEAHRAISPLASQLDMTVEETALGILAVADASMVRAIKVISMERGHDPRDFTLVSFGGAGGLHACRMAEALEIPRVLVPRHPGLLSAWGMLHAPRACHLSQTMHITLARLTADPLSAHKLRDTSARMRQEALTALHTGHDELPATRWTAALRYAGQTFTCDVPLEHDPDALCAEAPGARDTLRARFATTHEALYGWHDATRPVELVTLRLVAETSALDADQLATPDEAASTDSATPEQAAVWFGAGTQHKTSVVERATLAEGARLHGPAIVTEYSGTTVIPPGWVARVEAGHLLLTHAPTEDA